MIALWYLLSLASLVAGTIVQPRAARCPAGWSLGTGVQPDGSLACWHERDDAERPDGVVLGKLYCRAGELAITDDGVSASCRRAP
jgi:hypothetical protein